MKKKRWLTRAYNRYLRDELRAELRRIRKRPQANTRRATA